MSLRIAILTPLYEPSIGGVQETMRLWAKYLAGQGCDVRVYTSQLRSLDELQIGRWPSVRHHADEEKRDGVLVRRYRGGGAGEFFAGLVYAVSHRLRLPISPSLYDRYRRMGSCESTWLKEIRAFEPQAILVAPCTEYLLHMAKKARELTGAKLLVQTSLHLDFEKPKRIRRMLSMLRNVDAVLVNTVRERDVLAPHLSDSARIHVNSVGVDVEELLRPYPEEQADPGLVRTLSGRPFVLFLARKQQGKGMNALVHAARRLNKEFPELITVLAGEETEYSTRVLSKLLDDADFILTPGVVMGATKQWLFKNAKMFCMVSNVDSYGIVYCEAWLHGLPVIAADTPQMRCVVRDGEDGLLVPYDDDLRLADAVKSILLDPSKGKRMGQAGREKILSEFGDRRVEKEIHALILRLVR